MSYSTKLVWRYPQLIAHRGAGKSAPENTMVAFQLGAKNGYKMFECDVKLSQDKELFLLHDTTLNRTTNGQGLANSLSWQALEKLDAGSWHSSEYQGEPLMKLSDLVDYILQHRLRLDIEVKPNGGEAYETGKAVALYLLQRMQQKIDDYVERFFSEEPVQFFSTLHNALVETPEPCCLKNQFLISSFEPEALLGAKESVPKIPRALIVDDWSLGEEYIDAQLASLECQGVIMNYRLMTPELLAKYDRNNLFVMAYTPNKCEEIKQLLAMGVTSVITDNMDIITDRSLG